MASDGVERTHFVPGVPPRAAYDVVVDFTAYPRLFPEITAARVVQVSGRRHRVEFRAQVVMPVRYVLDIECDPETPAVDWTFVEGDVVTDSRGAWRFAPEGGGTRMLYRASMAVAAPLPGFVLRKITDALVSLSIPRVLQSVAREAGLRASPARA